MNYNCKICKTPMKRDMRNVKARDYSKVINWLGNPVNVIDVNE